MMAIERGTVKFGYKKPEWCFVCVEEVDVITKQVMRVGWVLPSEFFKIENPITNNPDVTPSTKISSAGFT